MKNIYISSTYEDLKEYRQAVADVLRNCGYNVDAMEKYPARDDRPKVASEADAASCDIYVGIFAWRYGYVPSEDNPEGKSITELECLAAERAQKPRLMFLLAEDAPWPSSLRDAEHEKDEGKKIRDLRNRLKNDRWAAFFKSPDDLAKQVLTSVFQYESTKRVADTAAIDPIKSAAEMGSSFLPNIQHQIEQLGLVEFIALRLGPTPWLNTRLHLAAALASDFTEIRGFVFLDEQGGFLILASPVEIRRALVKTIPKLEMAYLQSREQAQNVAFPKGEVDRIVLCYPGAVTAVFAGTAESDVKQVVTPMQLRELGIKPEGELVEQFGAQPRRLLNSDLVRRRAPYVVLMRNGNMEGVAYRDSHSPVAAVHYRRSLRSRHPRRCVGLPPRTRTVRPTPRQKLKGEGSATDGPKADFWTTIRSKRLLSVAEGNHSGLGCPSSYTCLQLVRVLLL